MPEFVQRLSRRIKSGVEKFPFLTLSDPKSSTMWAAVTSAMKKARSIRFNLKGMTKENFQAWMKEGWHRVDGSPYAKGFTNRELYEILTNPRYLKKSKFYDALGKVLHAPPTDWLVVP